MKRIAVIGTGGSGKTTLSLLLGKTLHIPVHHLDNIFHGPKWEKPSLEKRIEILKPILAQEGWILDGNWSKSFDQVFAAADTIIFLDMPRPLMLWRVTKRRLLFGGVTRPDMGGGNVERFDIAYLKFMRWIWRYPRKEVLEKLKALPREKSVVILRSPKEVDRFVIRNSSDLISFQKAEESDIPTLIAAEQTTVGARTYSALLTEEEWKEELGKGVTYLIRAQDELVGHISYEQKSDTHVYISGLVIRPEFQRKGYARSAVMKLIAGHPEAKRIDLVTHPDGPAIGLYTSLGFVIEERKEDYFGDGEPRVVMALVRG